MAIKYRDSRIENFTMKINAAIDEEYESAKAESSTFGELKERLEELKTGIRWGCSNSIAEYAGEAFRKKLDKEMSDQQIGQNQLGIEKKRSSYLEGTEEHKAGIREMENEVLGLKKAAEETMRVIEKLESTAWKEN